MNKATSKTMFLITVILMDLLVGMELDLFVPSFPELQSHFNLSAFWVEALLSINFAGYGLGLFFVGSLADRYGRKPILLGGLLTFVFGSILCLGAASYYFLLLGRLFQGIGIAAPAILSFLIIADTYPIKKQQFWLAMLNGAMNTFVAIAPVVGSYLTLYFHWEANFIALLILGLITLMMTILFIPTYKIQHESKEELPLLGYITVFQSEPLRLLLISIIFTIVPYWIFVGVSPLLYMRALGVSFSRFGYYQGVLALVFALGSVLYGLNISRYSQKKMLWLSLGCFIASLAMFGFLTLINSTHPGLISFALLLFVIGQIVPTTILYPLSLNFIPQVKGRVSALIGIGRLILSSLGLQWAGYYYEGSFRNIGIVLIGFILIVVVTFIQVIRNPELMAGVA